MTKQNYEKSNMEIVVIDDMIKTSGGAGGMWNSTCSANSFVCMGSDAGTGCNPDICSDFSCSND